MTSPDAVVGLAMIAVALAGLVIGFVTTLVVLNRPASLEPTENDVDAMAARIAWHTQPRQACGRPTPWPGTTCDLFGGHPGEHLPNLSEVVDHVLCDGGCGQILCCCRPLDGPRCTGTVEQACGHLNPYCTGCALAECDPCLLEATTGWFGGHR